MGGSLPLHPSSPCAGACQGCPGPSSSGRLSLGQTESRTGIPREAPIASAPRALDKNDAASSDAKVGLRHRRNQFGEHRVDAVFSPLYHFPKGFSFNSVMGQFEWKLDIS